MTTHFDEALVGAVDIAAGLKRLGLPSTVVRDVLGRCRIVIDDRSLQGDIPSKTLGAASARLAELAPFTPSDDRIVLASELIDSGSLLDDPARAYINPPDDPTAAVPLIERTVIGAEWRKVERGRPSRPAIPQVVFYSLKGGVGRSTAAIFLARALADDGHCVVLVDLDLESPGLGDLLLSNDAKPDYGLVDVVVEAAAGLDVADRAVTRCMEQALSRNGEVWLAPAAGRRRPNYTYLPKLDRCYLDLSSTDGGAPLGFADRLGSSLASITSAVSARSRQPSVVLIDSRAGMHDIAGVALTHLADLGLLFAVDTEPTWWGYRVLLEQWRERPKEAEVIRERLKLVAAMVDKVDADTYLEAMVDRAASCFEAIYDQAGPNDLDAFAPAPADRTAPHYPLPILFDDDLRQLTTRSLKSALLSAPIRASYGSFVSGVRELLGESLGETAS